ncbi:SAM-dependent methyltransferase [Actinomadura rugatobispora]|uniref:SAM-dependent methyltransferase n=1 Tax=Actinomadura rugatobispora TaxID=1994 RepID=A0ABW1A4Y2_9ACTN|nr:SAM-dependent methyltransferase [Actinomadura rugatobispora]
MPEAAFEAAAGFDALRPSSARMYDYFLSGKDNYAADRSLAERLRRAAPVVRVLARANRDFLLRAVRTLAAEAGIAQFLDIGCGLPGCDNVHQAARRVLPGARVAYVDNDPMVVAHAQALMAADGGTVAFQADLRSPEALLADRRLRAVIDLERPVAVLLTAVLHHLPDEDDPHGLVARVRDALPPGSHVVVSHAETTPALRHAAALHNAADTPFVPRTRESVAAFFDGMEPLPPGMDAAIRWRPDDAGNRLAGIARVPLLGGVARIPGG